MVSMETLCENDNLPEILTDTETPEDFAMRSYAREMYEGALKRLQARRIAKGAGKEFDLLRVFLRDASPTKDDFDKISMMLDKKAQTVCVALSRRFHELAHELFIHVRAKYPDLTENEVAIEVWFILQECGLPENPNEV